jgi:hypothetical protein
MEGRKREGKKQYTNKIAWQQNIHFFVVKVKKQLDATSV